MKLEGTTIHEAVETLSKLRRYAPYRFGGKWFVAILPDGACAYRSKATLQKAMARHNIQSAEVATL